MAAPKVLLLIDDPAFRARVIPALRSAGIDTVMTGDPEVARELLEKQQPVLALIDSKLPGMSGLDWLRARRAEFVGISAVLCAASNEEMKAFLQVGTALAISSVVNRAVPPETLARHIDEILVEIGAVPTATETGPIADALSGAVEALRVALLRLQTSSQRRDDIERAVKAVERSGSAFASLQAEAAIASAKSIGDTLRGLLVGRGRLDSGTFSEFDRLMARARAAVPTAPSLPSNYAPVSPSGIRKAPGLPFQDMPSARMIAPPAGGGVIPGGESAAPPVETSAGNVLPRETFLRSANDLLSAAGFSGRPLSVCVLRVTGADALRQAGTLGRVMREVERFLMSRFRPVDRRGRWDDAGFAIAIPGTPAKMAVDLMGRTLQAFAGGVRVVDGAGQPIPVALGAGVVAGPKAGVEIDAMLARATRAADTAAAGGGGVREG